MLRARSDKGRLWIGRLVNEVTVTEAATRGGNLIGEYGFLYGRLELDTRDGGDDRRSRKDNRCDWRCETMKNDAEMTRKLRYKR